jgi:cytochrome c peroxidase
LAVIDTDELLSKFARRTMSPIMAVWPIYPSLGYSLWRRCKLPGNGPRSVAVVGTEAFVAEYFSDTVAVVDLANETPARTIALGPTPILTPHRRGEMLFHDATICFQQWQSCASCHPDGRVDALNWDLMNDNVGNPKNTKSMLLAHATPPAMATGVRGTAEHAVRSGISSILFANRPNEESAAMDAYLRSLEPVPSPHLVDGRLSPAAERGRDLFYSKRVRCDRCHPQPLYTDLRSHNVGSRGTTEYTDRFDTPTLVEVWRTAPYLHDGRYATMKEVFVEGEHGLRNVREPLSDQEIDDLVEFVLSL